MSAPPAGFSEDVVSTPDGGLIIKLLLEAKNATKTAKSFLLPPKKRTRLGLALAVLLNA